MTDWIVLTIGATFLLVGIPLHEFIHWITLKILGYKGKLIIIKKHFAIGIKPIGLKNNIICASDAMYFTLSPVIITIIWFALGFEIMMQDIPKIIAVPFGALIGLLSCGMDIFQSLWIKKWWLSRRRV
jgi:hypothetical protein